MQLEQACDRETTSRVVLGISIPRAGHHYMARLLQATLGGRLRYCKFYGVAGCCGAVPCRAAAAPLLFQKNHDLELTLRRDQAAFHLVQYRHPVPAALSDRELYARHFGDDLAGDPVRLMLWLAGHAIWLRKFLRKWVLDPPTNALVLPYERLVADPAGSVGALLERLGIAYAGADLAFAVQRESVRGGWDGQHPFQPRSLAGSRYFDARLFGLFETLVIEQLPELALRRCLPRQNDPTHPFLRCHRALQLISTGALEEAADCLESLQRELGAHPAILVERARLAELGGDQAAAMSLLLMADGGQSSDPSLLLRRIALARRGDDLALAEALTRRLIGSMPDHAGHRVLLALVLSARGQRAATCAAVEAALAVAPAEATHWCSLADALLRVGENARAIALVRTAQGTWPDDSVLASLQDRARVQVGG